jgi:CubicO group peptidase (beta-lactamase class C family)
MRYFIYKLLVVFVIGCSPPGRHTPDSKLRKKVDSYLSELVERQQIVGLAVAATRNDTVLYTGSFGFRSVSSREPMKPSYNFHWASVSKTFVATAILQLVEEDKIDLDDKVITYVPYFKQKGDQYQNITIKQMLNHTSGIGDVQDYQWDKPQNDDGAPERYVRSLENDEMVFAPGTDWSYSNTAYEILGVVITNVSGMPFETYVKNNILEPLEMYHSSFIYPEIPDSIRVSGHVWAGKAIVSDVYPYNKIHAPSSTLNSNVIEMINYAKAHLHRGVYKDIQILADSSYYLLWTNSVNLEEKPAVGLSWFLNKYKGLKTVSHSGGDTGFRSFFLLVPEKNISVMVACNYELCQTRDIAHAVLDLVLGQEPGIVKRQIGIDFAEVLMKNGLDEAKSFYRDTEHDTTNRRYYLWKEDEGAMTYPGYLLLDQKIFSTAVEIFKFNLELHPDSPYAYAHLGIAYGRSGNRELAILNLRKAIELAPDEQYFKDELKELEAPSQDHIQ